MRNCPDGRVEANIEGAESEVEDMIECMRCGPPAALVENLRVWNADNCDFESFDVRH